jgi:hypothetical protein
VGGGVGGGGQAPNTQTTHAGIRRCPGRQQGRGQITPRIGNSSRLFQSDEIIDLRVCGAKAAGQNELKRHSPSSYSGRLDAADRSKLLDDFVGRTLRLKVVSAFGRRRIVFSERAAQAEPQTRPDLPPPPTGTPRLVTILPISACLSISAVVERTDPIELSGAGWRIELGVQMGENVGLKSWSFRRAMPRSMKHKRLPDPGGHQQRTACR